MVFRKVEQPLQGNEQSNKQSRLRDTPSWPSQDNQHLSSLQQPIEVPQDVELCEPCAQANQAFCPAYVVEPHVPDRLLKIGGTAKPVDVEVGE